MTERQSKPGSIVPTDAATLRTLTAVMAVMCFLAMLSVGAMLLINRAVAQWASGLASEVTVQLPQLSSRDMDQDLTTLTQLLAGVDGVRGVTVLDRKEGEKLLAPWIGEDGLDALPIPRLIRVVVDDKHQPDFAVMEAQLQAAVPTARLDTHRKWEAELRRMASTLTMISSVVLGLISLSAIAMVIFAARAVLEANRNVVEVLHIAGADDDFIANQINRRFIAAGFWSGLIGLTGGVAMFLALGYWDIGENSGVASAARGLFYLPREGDWRSLAWFLLVPIAATSIALVTSRMALKRMLGEAQ
jgi:cell division transport system permease protein